MRALFPIALALAALPALAACDSGTPEQPQGAQDQVGNESQAAKRGEGAQIETADGMKAQLTYDHQGSPYLAGTFTDPDGQTIDLANFKGRPLLVNLWATWCAPCVKEMPTLDALAAGNDKLQVLTVSQDLDGRQAVDPFWVMNGFTTIQPYTDTNNNLLTALGGNAQLPTTILYNAKGQEVWRLIGPTEWTDPAVADMLAEAGEPEAT
ncbi:TlpA family protein disulfide reductase [Novosphingopyxis sp. YJ-S2-01]|uniref:TlpA family protein disulfide reductase n=1 Tax=Novosphingopyxis sp. YJ-S2-01 TaxID=2794021 RepID=UPI001E2AC869|nr:TlpA disulfide reductase family protein [Novosphingopyxis sp. YJ-S2-01]